MGDVTPVIGAAAKEVAGEDPDKRARLICETLLEPKLATRATPVASLMPTPMGLEPTVTSGTASAGGFFFRSTMDAVPAALLATTAIPRWEFTATPCGPPPIGVLLSIVPKVRLPGAGLMSMTERLLPPALLTSAIGENGPF